MVVHGNQYDLFGFYVIFLDGSGNKEATQVWCSRTTHRARFGDVWMFQGSLRKHEPMVDRSFLASQGI